MKKSKFFALNEFLSYREIFLIFVFSVLLLVILYPKDELEELLASPEETNVDLTKKYLRVLIKTKSPEELKESILRKYAQVETESEFRKVLEMVKRSNPTLAYEFEYEFLKRKYFSESESKETLRREINGVLRNLILLESRPEKLELWFKESVSMNYPNLAYLAARKLANLTGSQRWYEEAFLYAIYSGNSMEAKKFVGKFKPTKKETYIPVYYFLIEQHRYQEALNLLQDYAIKYPEEKEKIKEDLMITYFLLGRIKEGEEILNELIEGKGEEEKKILVLTSIKKVMGVGAYEEAKGIIWRYLPLFKNDRRALKELLKLSLQTGDPYFAAEVAEEIVRR